MPTSVPGFNSRWMNSKWTPHGRRMAVHQGIHDFFAKPEQPHVPDPKPAPTPLDPGVLDARLRERARTRAAAGRRGTISTGPSGLSGSPILGYPAVLGG